MFKTVLMALVSLLSLGTSMEDTWKKCATKGSAEICAVERSGDENPIQFSFRGGASTNEMAGYFGTKACSTSAENFKSFEVLRFEDGTLDDLGAGMLAETLKGNCLPGLRELWLARNCIGSQGRRALESAKEDLPNLLIFGLDEQARCGMWSSD